ncbi:hypothetical protein ACLB2K_012402 [Fragaria x ananassa]
MPEGGVVLWNSMIKGYLKSVDLDEAIEESGVESDVVIGTALVDLYGKCGCVEKDTLAWTAMISVFALHGFRNEAFDLFEKMEAAGVEPNHVVLVGMLSACDHSGLVEKGCWCLDVMTDEIFIIMHAWLIYLAEAERLIRIIPDVYVWGALHGGCQIHGQVEIGEMAAHRLIDMEPLNHASSVNLCDIYAKAGRFNDVRTIKSLMKERGIQKEVAGCSMMKSMELYLNFQ